MNWLKLAVLIIALSFNLHFHAIDNVYIAKYKLDKKCAISYTFDDGLSEHYSLVFPAFEKLGFKATFWINGKTINEGEKGLQTEKPRTSWSELNVLSDNGHEVSNHGWSHKSLPKISLDEAEFEILKNDSVIFEKIGVWPVTFCYPGNAKNPEIIKLASKNRVGTRTSQFSVGSKSTTENLKIRLDSLLLKEEWGVAMTHGITYGYDAFKNDSVFWNHLAEVKSMEDKIWVATFKDVSAYKAEYEKTVLKIKKKKNMWIVTPDCSLNESLFNYPLTMVICTKDNKKIKIKQNGKKINPNVFSDKLMFEFNPHFKDIKIYF